MSDITGLNPKDMTPDQLRQALREARLDRDGWHTQARLAENHLARIKRSPAWRISKPLRILNLLAWKFKPSLYSTESENLLLDESAPLAWNLVKTGIRIESEGADLSNNRIAVLAQWSSTKDFPIGTQELIRQLIENEYSVVLVSANELVDDLNIPAVIKDKITVIRKPNFGYDFGSWSAAFHIYPQIFNTEHLLILNDSNAGPFSSISEIISKLENSPYDLTGITDSLQIRYHLQSYLLHLNNAALSNKAIQKFWLEIRHLEDKSQVIKSYELGLTSMAQSQNLFAGAIFPWNLVSDYWENPSIHGANRLIELGFPFVKRELLRTLDVTETELLTQRLAIRFKASPDSLKKILNQKTY